MGATFDVMEEEFFEDIMLSPCRNDDAEDIRRSVVVSSKVYATVRLITHDQVDQIRGTALRSLLRLKRQLAYALFLRAAMPTPDQANRFISTKLLGRGTQARDLEYASRFTWYARRILLCYIVDSMEAFGRPARHFMDANPLLSTLLSLDGKDAVALTRLYDRLVGDAAIRSRYAVTEGSLHFLRYLIALKNEARHR